MKPGARVHLVGIGGIGMSAVARGLKAFGYHVTGSDVQASALTKELIREGIGVKIGHLPAHVEGADVVVISSAVSLDNVEVIAACNKSLPVIHRSQALAKVMDRHTRSFGVLGTHGKGTVAAMITRILEQAGELPSFIIGGLLLDYNKTNARIGDLGSCVVEVDESDGSHKNINPDIIVLNNLEVDHLNYYTDLADIQRSIVGSIRGNHRLQRVVLNVDSPGASPLANSIPVPLVRFGWAPPEVEPRVDYVATQEVLGATHCEFSIAIRGKPARTRIVVPLAGRHNLENALAAAATCLSQGIDIDSVVQGIANCHGLENRFGVREVEGIRIIKDYVSHPTGIRHVLTAAAIDSRPITVVFRPYRFTLLRYLQDEYARAFELADRVIVASLDPAGESPICGISSQSLCDRLRRGGIKQVAHAPDDEHIRRLLVEQTDTNRQLVFFGGPDLFGLADEFVEYWLKTKNQE